MRRVSIAVARRMNRKKRAFLSAFEKSLQVTAAAASVRVSPATVYRWRRGKSDPEFEKAFDEIAATIADVAESETIRRAIYGVEKAVRFQGEVVGTEVVYSDALLMQLNRARNPLYKESGGVNVNVHGDNVGLAILPMQAPSEEEWEAQSKALTAMQNRVSEGVTIEGKAERVDEGAKIKRG
jgi:hypothetical protein